MERLLTDIPCSCGYSSGAITPMDSGFIFLIKHYLGSIDTNGVFRWSALTAELGNTQRASVEYL